MADIFDHVASGGGGDIFDQVASSIPGTDRISQPPSAGPRIPPELQGPPVSIGKRAIQNLPRSIASTYGMTPSGDQSGHMENGQWRQDPIMSPMDIARSAGHAIMHPIDTAKEMFAQDPLGTMAAAGGAARGAIESAPAVADATASAARATGNAVKSVATNPTMIKGAAAIAGGAIGHATGIPEAGLVGAIGGREIGAGIVRRMASKAAKPPMSDPGQWTGSPSVRGPVGLPDLGPPPSGTQIASGQTNPIAATPPPLTPQSTLNPRVRGPVSPPTQSAVPVSGVPARPSVPQFTSSPGVLGPVKAPRPTIPIPADTTISKGIAMAPQLESPVPQPNPIQDAMTQAKKTVDARPAAPAAAPPDIPAPSAQGPPAPSTGNALADKYYLRGHPNPTAAAARDHALTDWALKQKVDYSDVQPGQPFADMIKQANTDLHKSYRAEIGRADHGQRVQDFKDLLKSKMGPALEAPEPE